MHHKAAPTITGDELKQWRRRLGASQPQVAQVMGVDRSTLQRWERDTANAPAYLEFVVDSRTFERRLRALVSAERSRQRKLKWDREYQREKRQREREQRRRDRPYQRWRTHKPTFGPDGTSACSVCGGLLIRRDRFCPRCGVDLPSRASRRGA